METPLKTNFLRIGNNDHELWASAIYIDFGEDIGYDFLDFTYTGSGYAIILRTKGITYSHFDEELEYYGTGYKLNIFISSNNSNYLDIGTYNFPTKEPLPIGTFAGSYEYLYNSSETEYDIQSGTAIINNYTGNTIEITLNCNSENDMCVKTHFIGEIDPYEIIVKSSQQRVIKKAN